MPPKPLPPDNERCEFMTGNGFHYRRCDNRGKHVVIGYPSQNWQTHEPEGDPREVRVCGVHKRVADRGGSHGIFLRKGKFRDESQAIYLKRTDVEALKEQLWRAELNQKWDRRKPKSARDAAGRAMFDQAPEILEMLFMVAERGDQRAWAAIKTIQDGMSEVEKADAEYQALVDKIEALKAKIEQAKGEQA